MSYLLTFFLGTVCGVAATVVLSCALGAYIARWVPEEEPYLDEHDTEDQ